TKSGTSTMTGVTGGSTNFGTLTEIVGAANKLAFSQQPTDTTAGSAFSPAVTVLIQDQFGNPTTSGATVGISISVPGVFTGASTLSVSASSGIATFNNLVPTKAGANFTLSAASGVLTGATSSTFNVNAAAAAKLAFIAQPTNTTAGSAVSPAVTVQIQ